MVRVRQEIHGTTFVDFDICLRVVSLHFFSKWPTNLRSKISNVFISYSARAGSNCI